VSLLHPDRRKLLVAGTLFLLALTAAFLRAGASTEVLGVRVGQPSAMGDFKSVIHCPVLTFMRGGNPYEHRQLAEVCPKRPVFPLYAPGTLVLHAPFGLLPFDAAARAFAAWTVVLTVLMAYLAFRVNDLMPTKVGVIAVAALVLLSRPGQWNLLMGNLAVELTVATYIALYYARRSPLTSAIGLAVATIKPTFGVPLAILMVARRDYRAVALGVVFSLLLNLPPWLVLVKRAGGLDQFAQSLIESQQGWGAIVASSSVTTAYRADLTGFLSRLAGHPLGSPAEVLVALLVLLAAAIAIRTLEQQTEPARRRLSSDIACVAIVLGVYHLGYDLVLLTAPAIALALRTLPHGFATERFRRVMLLLIAGLGANYLTSEAVLVHLWEHRLVWLLLASINGVLLLALFLGYVTRSLRLGGAREFVGPPALTL
jgi:hypothetical protein